MTQLEMHTRLRACDECGLLLRLSQPTPGMDCRCPRCDAVLRRNRHSTVSTPMAFAVTSLLLCIVTFSMPFLTVRLLGRVQGSTVPSGGWAFLEDGLWMLSLLLVLTVVLVPLLRLSLLLLVLGGLALPRSPGWLFRPLRWHQRLGAWSMLEIFLLGAMISYTRVAFLADVQLGPAVYAIGALVLAMIATDAAFEPQAAWEALEARGVAAAPAAPILALQQAPLPLLACTCCRCVVRASQGQPCPRCGIPLHRRKPASVAQTWALIAAAAILYVPANLYPVMTIVTRGRSESHTILGGIAAFAENGFWPLAAIVFATSIVVPLLKLGGLSFLLLQLRSDRVDTLHKRAVLYRAIELAGRWSMIDVFIVGVLIALVRFGIFASVHAGIGAACFGAVVVLTMLAAQTFDPRLMWDTAAADGGRHARSAAR